MKKRDDPDLVDELELTDPDKDVTVTLYRTPEGNLFDNERAARYEACTHVPCSNEDCDQYAQKGWTICRACRRKKKVEKYESMDTEPWPEENKPTTILGEDQYFHDPGHFIDWCLDHHVTPGAVMLVHTKSVGTPNVDPDWLFEDYLPRDRSVQSLDEDIWEAIEQLREAIEEHAPYGFVESDTAVEIPEEWDEEYAEKSTDREEATT